MGRTAWHILGLYDPSAFVAVVSPFIRHPVRQENAVKVDAHGYYCSVRERRYIRASGAGPMQYRLSVHTQLLSRQILSGRRRVIGSDGYCGAGANRDKRGFTGRDRESAQPDGLLLTSHATIERGMARATQPFCFGRTGP